MSMFKEAAIKILTDSKEPMHYKEITEKAIKMNLIKTNGFTPDATMNSLIYRDIKNKKEKSAFVKVKQGYYTINPDFNE